MELCMYGSAAHSNYHTLDSPRPSDGIMDSPWTELSKVTEKGTTPTAACNEVRRNKQRSRSRSTADKSNDNNNNTAGTDTIMKGPSCSVSHGTTVIAASNTPPAVNDQLQTFPRTPSLDSSRHYGSIDQAACSGVGSSAASSSETLSLDIRLCGVRCDTDQSLNGTHSRNPPREPSPPNTTSTFDGMLPPLSMQYPPTPVIRRSNDSNANSALVPQPVLGFMNDATASRNHPNSRIPTGTIRGDGMAGSSLYCLTTTGTTRSHLHKNIHSCPQQLPSRRTSMAEPHRTADGGGRPSVTAASSLLAKSSKSDAFAKIEKLQESKICLHCKRYRWTNSLSTVCKYCINSLEKITCRHCRDDAVQHRFLQQAASQFKRHICLRCAKLLSLHGDPVFCELCKLWCAFGGHLRCLRCEDSVSKYGQPKDCVSCGACAAFEREPQKMAKVDNLLLCHVCITKYKIEKYRTQRHANKTHNCAPIVSPAPTTPGQFEGNLSCDTAEAKERLIEEMNKKIAEQNRTIHDLQQKIMSSEVAAAAAVDKAMSEMVILKEDAAAANRRAAKEEAKSNEYKVELLIRKKETEREMQRLIAVNQEERKNLSEVISTLKTSNENLESQHDELVKEVATLRRSLHSKDDKFANYKSSTEMRVADVTARLRSLNEDLKNVVMHRDQQIEELKNALQLNMDDCADLRQQLLVVRAVTAADGSTKQQCLSGNIGDSQLASGQSQAVDDLEDEDLVIDDLWKRSRRRQSHSGKHQNPDRPPTNCEVILETPLNATKDIDSNDDDDTAAIGEANSTGGPVMNNGDVSRG